MNGFLRKRTSVVHDKILFLRSHFIIWRFPQRDNQLTILTILVVGLTIDSEVFQTSEHMFENVEEILFTHISLSLAI